MKRYDPEQIVDNLRAGETAPERVLLRDNTPATLSRESSADEVRQNGGDPVSDNANASVARGFTPQAPGAITLPELPLHLVTSQIIPTLAASADISHVPHGTRWSSVKRLLQRFLRIITGQQVNFNRNAANAIQIWAEHAEKVDDALAQILAHLSARDSVLTLMEQRFGDINRTHDKVTQGLVDANQRFQAVHQRIENVDRNVRQLGDEMRNETEARMRRMLSLFRDELRSVAAVAGTTGAANAPHVSPSQSEALCDDLSYVLYEDRWRGSKAMIRQWQENYLKLIEPHLGTLAPEKRHVLDVGCGRGEFLALLQERGIRATGVEINEAQARLAKEDGIEVQRGDALSFLEGQRADTFGAIVAFQVVEHLGPEVLRRFLDLARAKLAPGGICVFETLNPGSFSAYRWYFMDPTHRAFLTPETLRMLGECAGLEHVETKMIHPMPEHERLAPAGDETERRNLERLNELLFGCQDYYVVMRRQA
jgi:SAM-dependent methyltransferase